MTFTFRRARLEPWAPVAALAIAFSAAGLRAEEPRPAGTGRIQGITYETADKAFVGRLGSVVQLDGRFFVDDEDDAGVDTFEIRRGRLVFQGTAFSRFDFLIVPEFGQGKTVLLDAYLDIRFSPAVALKAGKFKTPFGLERLQPDPYQLFPETALATVLVPNRDVGLALHGDLANGALGYTVAVVNGVADGANGDGDSNDSKDVAARVFLQPFRARAGSPAEGLGLGFAVMTGEQKGAAALPGYKTFGQQTFFAYAGGASASGGRTRVAPQASYRIGPFRTFAEWVRVSQEVQRGAASARVVSEGWEATASFLLTGETAGEAGVIPRRRFDPAAGGWGAFEIAARVHGVRVSENAFTAGLASREASARRAQAWTLGVNWWLNGNVRLAAAFERTTFEGGSARGDRAPENVLVARFQIAF